MHVTLSEAEGPSGEGNGRGPPPGSGPRQPSSPITQPVIPDHDRGPTQPAIPDLERGTAILGGRVAGSGLPLLGNTSLKRPPSLTVEALNYERSRLWIFMTSYPPI